MSRSDMVERYCLNLHTVHVIKRIHVAFPVLLSAYMVIYVHSLYACFKHVQM
jgi:hypothetical protein